MTLALDLRVAAATTPCPGVRSLAFAADGEEPLPSYPPGSHIGIEWAPGRVNLYSLTGPTRDPELLHVSVALAAESAGGSRWMHRLAVGDRVRATRPRSAFPPVETAAHHLLVAGGIGATPIVSHARWHAFWGNSFEVFFAHRPGAAPHADDLGRLCGDRLRTVTGRAALLDAVAARLRAAPFNSHVYTCGPPGMIHAVAHLAREAHWVDERVHAEAFTRVEQPGLPFRAVLRRSGRAVDVGPSETLLEALERSGVRAPSLCRRGVCGECLTGVGAGRIDHRDSVLSPAERAAGTLMAPCVSRADGPLLEIDR